MSDSKISEKERAAQLKALRRELERDLEADLRGLSLRGAPEGRRSNPSEIASASLGSPPRNDKPAELSPKRVLEALLFASAKPLTINEIQKIVGAPLVGAHENQTERADTRSAPTVKEIKNIILELQEEYNREGRSFELIEIAGGFEIATRKEYATWLGRLELERKARQASRSALETLAILAYKQPVTRAEIEELRGVDISGVLSTLLERGFIRITGKKEVPGRPFLYGTTGKFLEHFGLKSVKDLPSIGEIKSLVERAVRKEEWSEPQGTAPEN